MLFKNLPLFSLFMIIPMRLVLDGVAALTLLNKPKGYVCSNSDKYNKKTIFDLIDSDSRLFTIGRLDRDTTGILLITNNGDLAYQLTHPKHEVEKKYYITSIKDIDNKNVSKLKKGIRLDDGLFVKADLNASKYLPLCVKGFFVKLKLPFATANAPALIKFLAWVTALITVFIVWAKAFGAKIKPVYQPLSAKFSKTFMFFVGSYILSFSSFKTYHLPLVPSGLTCP